MTDSTYCRHCEAQIESCLEAADSAAKSSIRVYFLMLAGKWTRLARDLESKQSCGHDCPLRKACERERAARPSTDTTQPDAPRQISAVA
jgi:hypothetical protein